MGDSPTKSKGIYVARRVDSPKKGRFVRLAAVGLNGNSDYDITIRCDAIIAVEEDDTLTRRGCWVSFGTQKVHVQEIYTQVVRAMTGGEEPLECEQYT